jgi:hypothetical protein
VADSIGRPDSYRARARAWASASMSSVIGGAYPEDSRRCNSTVRMLGPVAYQEQIAWPAAEPAA